MEREILFRGKRVDNGEWVEGVPVKVKIGKRKEKAFIISAEFKSYDIFYDYLETSTFEVISSTVGQYTGLTDKNGRRIFEGDILKGFDYPFYSDCEFNYFADVLWFDNSLAFGIRLFKNPESNVKGVSDGLSYYLEDFNSDD